jgi:hypothetical protein
MRYRLVEDLVELASPAEEQVALLDQTGFPVQELALAFWNWLDSFSGTLEERGALSPEVSASMKAVVAAIEVIDRASAGGPGTPYLWTVEALRQAGEWESVRQRARSALEAFAVLGIPTPKLSDPDFNKPRSDAP